ncbi:MAG: sensor histidine kinase [Pyrinomonadaceae bacterium]
MIEASGGPRRLKEAAIIAAFYTFLTLLFIPQVYFYNSAAARPVSWGLAVGRLALANYIWAALTPLVFWLGRRLPVERPRVVRNLALHLPLSLAFAAVQTLAYHAILGAYFGDVAEAVMSVMRNPGFFLNFVTNGFVVYAGILAFNQAANYSRKYRDREFRLQQAQLQVLRMQLHPHFLFNTLNAVAALIHENPRAADRVVTQLSDLLRLSLAGGQVQEVTLKEELDFLRKYVEIQRTLLQERLEVSFQIEPGALDASVPSMVLQPLVENSIRHGIASRARGGRVEVTAHREGGTLRLSVRDDGVGLAAAGQNGGSGLGLSNTRARLARLYGSEQSFELRAGKGGGAEVTLSIPFKEQAAGRVEG